jgi:hypothetical protein
MASYEKQDWQDYKEEQLNGLLKEYETSYTISDGIERTIITEGIRSRLDNKFASAEKKAEAVKDQARLELADLMPTKGSSSQKSGLVEKAVNLGLDKTVAESMTARQLQAIINSLG